jgi:hypothetical protein
MGISKTQDSSRGFKFGASYVAIQLDFSGSVILVWVNSSESE